MHQVIKHEGVGRLIAHDEHKLMQDKIATLATAGYLEQIFVG